MAHILACIESVHDRLEAIEQLALGSTPHDSSAAGGTAAGRVPAWRRPTAGEARWQVAVCTAAAIALQLPVNGREILVHPADRKSVV